MSAQFIKDLPQLPAGDVAAALRDTPVLTPEDIRAVLANVFERLADLEDLGRSYL